MKKGINFKIFLFFLSLIFFTFNFFVTNILISESKTFAFGGEIAIDLKCENSSKIKESLIKNYGYSGAVKILKNSGFGDEEIAVYLVPESKIVYEKFAKIYYKNEIFDEIVINKNKCEMLINKGKSGEFLDKKIFYEQVVQCLIKNNKKIEIKLEKKSFKTHNIKKEDFVLKGEFKTNFSASNNERKNNIKVALAAFDGIILNEGESLSFNKTTGQRNEQKGYKRAKIISSGTFVSGFGGGVCQVSTTLYNACLLAGLEILEVHNHSLPVSYVEPSFDAMVSFGSSDLVVRNNTGSKIVICTSSENDVCKVVVFGKPNNYKVERVYKKTKTIQADSEEKIETDYKKYGLENLQVGESKIISTAKDGFVSEGYLNYFDEKGNLVKTKKIRENTYNPTKTIVVRKEK